MNPKVRPRLGEDLLARRLIDADQLQIALREQKRGGVLLGQQLCSLGFLSQADLDAVLLERCGQPVHDLPQTPIDPLALSLVPEQLAREHRILPLGYDAATRQLELAVSSANPLPLLDQLRWTLPAGCAITTYVVAESALLAGIEQHYHRPADLDEWINRLHAGADGAALTQWVDLLLDDAAATGASDIHLEPERGHLRLRYRIDGVLRNRRLLQREVWPGLLVQLKLLAGMDIAETRAAQDGRFSRTCGHRILDIRASSLPVLAGENLVLRVLDRARGVMPLQQLGLPAQSLAVLRRMLRQPGGLLLLTGPTGSGKTSTLYSLLAELNTSGVNIMTLEDPVEYRMPGIRQCSLGDALKLDFADGVRALMRQDPDILLIGEIRDAASAAMAVRAALTGHRVLATLHAHSAIGALPRLLDLGVSPALLSECLVGVIAQRLLRKRCPVCPSPQRPAERCPVCQGYGYRGRAAVMSLLPLKPTLINALLDPDRINLALQAVRQRGYMSLLEQARIYIEAGVTDAAEVERVLGAEADDALSL
ncbi:GspE/PulE family protein [Amantichitinum ursilacus]|uniref:Type II secretion system protein E n=1 Tax=Amantichitinum ursilacus TaxID=857265 RepID=A0A0N0XLS6_9NEIS|nr:GspE/PulE family protein [Amantichitinum ursilacus]KPC54007.1 Type II secretion system protein E [Amantichitinum ursilacus]